MSAMSVGFSLGVQLIIIWRWRGVWRWLAAAPLLMMVAFVASLPVLISYEPRIAESWLLILEVILLTSPLWFLLLGLIRLIIHCVTVF
jgi:hypothetical protein